jgi:hypothetical protein
MVFALTVGSGGAAFAATGDMIGLADLATAYTPRPSTYTADLSVGDYYELQIVPVLDDGAGGTYLGWFQTEDDTLAISWTQNTQGMANGLIDTSTYAAIASGNGYYLYVVAYNFATTEGPDSWRATYDLDPVVTGDFSFVATDYSIPDSGHVPAIDIELYDGPTTLTPFAVGSFGNVDGIDDYTSIPGDHGRSYSTALDAVAHGTFPPDEIITTYSKVANTQTLLTVIDLQNTSHTADMANKYGWMYAVYYQDTIYPRKWNRDSNSVIIGPDDYMLQEDALVIWTIDKFSNYDVDFPEEIER